MDQPRIVIIGSGFAGLGMAIRLKQEGIEDFVVVERDADIGGVWRDNDYPGAACDIPSHLYSFSFERDFEWSRAFAPRDDIFRYIQHCADAYGLRPHIRTGWEVASARFDEATARWEVGSTDGRRLRCEILITGTGQLSRPRVPSFPGLDGFRGERFHSARWNHAYPLEGKRVGVVGTGASAIQFVPPVAERAERLTVFQRSAPYVVEKKDRAYGRFSRWLFRTFPLLVTLHRAYIYCSAERYLPGLRNLAFLTALLRWSFRRQLRKDVPDAVLREKLTPDYAFGCKRVLFSNDYYPALTRPNVAVETSAIAEITEDAVITEDGQRHPVDCLIFGTGFDTSHFLAPIRVTGVAGLTLDEAWKDGAEAFLGLTVHGFPNLFMLYGPNTNLGHNSILYMLESQYSYVLTSLAEIESRGRPLQVRADRQAEYNRALQEEMAGMVWQSGCRSWYLDAHGKNTNNWPGFTFRYRALTRAITPEDYEEVPATKAVVAAPVAVPAP